MELNFLSEMVDLGLMIALVGIVEMIKRADKKSDSRNLFYMIIYAALCLFVGFFVSMQEGVFSESFLVALGSSMIRFIKYAGIGTVFYKLIARWIQKKEQGNEEGD